MPDELSVAQRDRLRKYGELLIKWNRRINLVSRSTISELETRHILDSLQLAQLAPSASTWMDVGSGGGLPVVPSAIVRPDCPVTAVESDQRKAAFLRTVSRETSTDLRVISDRWEDIDPQSSDVISARALAPLTHLLEIVSFHGHDESVGLFPKGTTWNQEVSEAKKDWRFSMETRDSIVASEGKILIVGNVERK